MAVAVVAAAALALVPSAGAGGSFERIVGVGSNGTSATINLDQSGSRSDSVLSGSPVAVPTAGYVRLYPFIGGLPAIPGRLYPGPQILCLYWHEPVSNCSRLREAAIKLLAPLAALPRRHEAPSTPVAVRYQSRLLRYADGNILAALELALERPALGQAPLPANAIALTVLWRSPNDETRPSRLFLTPIGVYAQKRLYPLQRGPWCYLAGNLTNAPAALIEATARICK